MENICANKDGIKCPLNTAEFTREKYKKADTKVATSAYICLKCTIFTSFGVIFCLPKA